jgi:hypothetical protein
MNHTTLLLLPSLLLPLLLLLPQLHDGGRDTIVAGADGIGGIGGVGARLPPLSHMSLCE